MSETIYISDRPVQERLYNNLPAIYRNRDLEEGEPLRALMAVLEREMDIVREDLDQLYDNWFIETCEEWVTSYIGDLLGIRGLYSGVSGVFSQKSYVANTLGYRRRKGTTAILEQIAKDATGWYARVLEYFSLLAGSQNINHIRPSSYATLKVSDNDAVELLGTGLETSTHIPDLRRIDQGGVYGIPNLGVHLWRLSAYRIRKVRPKTVLSGVKYTLDPLGRDIPLFNIPHTETSISGIAEEINLPVKLRRSVLDRETENLRKSLAYETYYEANFLGSPEPVVNIWINGNDAPIPAEEILISDLSGWDDPLWQRPPLIKSYPLPGSTSLIERNISVALDPNTGRIAFPATSTVTSVEVTYAYGFSGDLGGGSYNRRDSVDPYLPEIVDFHVMVSDTETPASGIVSTLSEAITQWNAMPAGSNGIISIIENHAYVLINAPTIEIPEGSSLIITSSTVPVKKGVSSVSADEILWGKINVDGVRSHIKGTLSVVGPSLPDTSITETNPGNLILDGLLIEGGINVEAGNLGNLRVAHSLITEETSVNIFQGQTISQRNPNLNLELDRCILRSVQMNNSPGSLKVKDTIIDTLMGTDRANYSSGDTSSITATDAYLEILSSTLFGKVECRGIEAENSIFKDTITSTRKQVGCVRYSYLPPGSETPRRYHCQPEIAIEAARQKVINERTDLEKQIAELETADPVLEAKYDRISSETYLSQTLTLAELKTKPLFTTLEWNDPSYMQLSHFCPVEVRTGSDDGSEMGAFSFLKQALRKANLRNNMKSYLRFGREAGIYYAT